MEENFYVSKQKDNNVAKEIITITTKENDVEFYFWKKLITGKQIYNRTIIEKEEFKKFCKKFLEEEHGS